MQLGSGSLKVSCVIKPTGIWFMPSTKSFSVHWYVNQVHIFNNHILGSPHANITSTCMLANNRCVIMDNTKHPHKQDEQIQLVTKHARTNGYESTTTTTTTKLPRSKEEYDANTTTSASKRAQPDDE